MKSVCTGHYPQIVYRNGQRRLWNPVMKKPAVSLPEERVRLRFLEALLHGSTIPPARITTEKGLEMIAGQAGRTDILCYDPTFKPQLLVECKREQVRLDHKAALQIGRYNEKINAPVLALSNGDSELWFSRSENGGMSRLDIPPAAIFPGNKHTAHDTAFWVERGFAGRAILDEGPDVQKWLQGLLDGAFSEDSIHGGSVSEMDMNTSQPDGEGRSRPKPKPSPMQIGERITYMHIPPSRHIRDLAHYYRVISWPHENLLIGVTSVSAPDGSTHFVALAVHGDMPVAMLQIDPLLLAGKSGVNAFFRAKDIDEGFDISKKAGWGLNSGTTKNRGTLSDLADITRTLLKDFEVITDQAR
jgi:hypothetical protein